MEGEVRLEPRRPDYPYVLAKGFVSDPADMGDLLRKGLEEHERISILAPSRALGELTVVLDGKEVEHTKIGEWVWADSWEPVEFQREVAYGQPG